MKIKSTLKYTLKHHKRCLAKPEKIDAGGITAPEFKSYFKVIVIKPVVLAQNLKYRPISQNRGPRNSSTKPLLPHFRQKCQNIQPKHTGKNSIATCQKMKVNRHLSL